MATDPQFASTLAQGAALLGAAETNLQVPVNSAVVLTAGASGTKIEEVVVQASQTTLIATTVAGQVYLFLHDGAAYHLFDTMLVTAATASATAASFRLARTYANLILESGWSLRASQSVAGNANILRVVALGGDF